MAAEKIGYGMGSEGILQRANCLRAFLGEAARSASDDTTVRARAATSTT